MLRCVIVDDSPGFLAAADRLLRREGVIVAGVAISGEEAMRQVARLHPDVVLVDIDLGGESGLELTERLHRQATGTPVRTILISTHAEQDYRDLIAASPAIGFLPKATISARAINDLLGDGTAGPPGT